MSLPRVYVETTIPSFYHETRIAPEIVARREWTRQWWSAAADRYELVTSPAVLDELGSGPSDRSGAWLALVAHLPVLTVAPAIVEIVQAYIRYKVMPANPTGDALHLALASYHKCDSWSLGIASISLTRINLDTFAVSTPCSVSSSAR
jgi:predicted nucleic acid-binding protein